MEEVTEVLDLHTNCDQLLEDVLNEFNHAFHGAEHWGFDIDNIKSEVVFDIMNVPDDVLSGVTAQKAEFFLEEENFNYQAYKQEKIEEASDKIFIARLAVPDGKIYIVFMEVLDNIEIQNRYDEYLIDDTDPENPEHQYDPYH